jgi:putative ABC transport system permease protein
MRSMLQEWVRDLKLAMRGLMRTPGFTAVTVITLGLGIGACAAIFAVVDKVLLRPLPYEHVDRLVYIAASAPGSQMPREFGVGEEFIQQYKQTPLIESVASFDSFTSTLRTDDRVERVLMSWPSRSLFETLGAKPILGRLPSTEEDAERTAVISHRLWTTWFGSDPNVIGRSHEMAGGRREIIGVMGPEFRFPADGTLLWITGRVEIKVREPGQFSRVLVARIAPGVTTEALARELTALSKRLPERFPEYDQYATLIGQHRAIVRSLREELLGDASPLWVLFGAVGIVLLIACANVANLFMVRTEGRHRELAVRRAVGAERGQLIRLQMAEALAVAGLAGVLAMALAAAGIGMFLRVAPEGIPRIDYVGIDFTLLLYTLGVAFVAALACGLIPAIRASSPDLTRLREAGRGSTRRRHWGRNGLVVAQTALALVLLISSGLLIRSFAKLSHVDPGYDTRDIFTFQIAPEGKHLNDGPSFATFIMDFMDRLRALPGVEMVGLVENVPINESTGIAAFRNEKMGDDPKAVTARINRTWAAGDYFKLMGIEVLAGEVFASRDLAATMGKVVVSRSAANLLWPGEDPVGRRLRPEGNNLPWMNVIGVVEDVMQTNFREAARPLVYFPLVGPTPRSWALSSPAYVIKTPRAEVIAPEVRALVREVAPNAPMYRVYTMAGLARGSMVDLSFTMMMLGIVSTLALILGAVGLYGVLSYVVAERTREIGVRMALGAEPGQVRRMVVAQGARVVALGILIGVGVALASTRALSSLLFGVAPLDIATFLAMSAAMVGVGLLASYIPARRASSVDPMESLRGD